MEPTLLILAAGMGSRYGGLKQIDSIGPSGETIMDYSIFDAKRAGIKNVVFVIKKEFEKEFNEIIIKKYRGKINIDYVFQSHDSRQVTYPLLPSRIKPWGTSHAVLSASEKIKEPFIVINADDFYGDDSFKILYEYLCSLAAESKDSYAMVGFVLKETLSENGTVTRAVCEMDENEYLKNIVERFKIKRKGNNIVHIENEKESVIDENALVSMNMWGFTPSVFSEFRKLFELFLENNYNNNEAEILLPASVNEIIYRNIAKVKVLKTQSEWFGLTYKEDKETVIKKINKLIASGKYPKNVLMC